MTRLVIAAAACLLCGPWGGTVATAQDGSQQFVDAVRVTRGLNSSSPGIPSPDTALDEVNEALLPYGELTPYKPLQESLDELLAKGWKLNQASGTLESITLLISNGDRQALCFLMPRDLGRDDEALVDCRRLN